MSDMKLIHMVPCEWDSGGRSTINTGWKLPGDTWITSKRMISCSSMFPFPSRHSGVLHGKSDMN